MLESNNGFSEGRSVGVSEILSSVAWGPRYAMLAWRDCRIVRPIMQFALFGQHNIEFIYIL